MIFIKIPELVLYWHWFASHNMQIQGEVRTGCGYSCEEDDAKLEQRKNYTIFTLNTQAILI